MDGGWKVLQSALVGVAEELVPSVPYGRRHQWMTQEILELIEERMNFKNRADNRYRELDSLIRRMGEEEKEQWLHS